MWQAHLSYDELNAGEWLHRTYAPEAEPAWKGEDVLFTAPHPWRRFFAKYLDCRITVMVLWVIRVLVFRSPIKGNSGLFEQWLMEVVSAFFEGIAEALLLCTIGTTPGKWIFGLRVRRADGKKLSFTKAASRALHRFIFGEACGIPLLNLWRYWVSYHTCYNEEVLPWDEGTAYHCTPHRWRHLLCIPAIGICYAVMFFAGVQSLLPVHQGPLTKSEFIENCETFARQHMGYGEQFLDDGLVWRRPQNSNYIVIDFDDLSKRSTKMPYELTTDRDGHITAVHIEYESHTDEGWIGYGFNGHVQILRNAYVMAQNRTGLFSLLRQDTLWEEADWLEDFTITDGCVRVTHEIAYSGYEAIEEKNILYRDEHGKHKNELPYYRWALTLELLESPQG